MTVAAAVYDTLTRDPLPGASIAVVNQVGTPTGGGVVSGADGEFTITDSELDAGGQLLISYVGYQPVTISPSTANATGFIGLDPNPDTLQAAVVTPATAKKSNMWPWLLGGGALLLLASSGKKKGKVSGTGHEVVDIALVGGAIAGAYFLVVKPILSGLGLSQSAAQKQTADAQQSALQAAIDQAKASGQGGQTYTQDQYTGWANDIYTQGTQSSMWNWTGTQAAPANQDAIVTDVINVNTMVDLQLLISAFGQRKAQCVIWGIDCNTFDLPSFLKLVLDTIHINKINTYLADTGINYQF